jgi:hypothetical protein
MRTQKNAYYVRLTIARQFLRCLDDEALAMRMTSLKRRLICAISVLCEAGNWLLPHLQSQTLRYDPVLLLIIYGQAGQAAARLGNENDALALTSRISAAGAAFGVQTTCIQKGSRKRRAQDGSTHQRASGFAVEDWSAPVRT